MQLDQLRAVQAIKRDLRAIELPVRVPLSKMLYRLQSLVLLALQTGETDEIDNVCNGDLLQLLNSATEIGLLKGGRRILLSLDDVIEEPGVDSFPVRFSLADNDNTQAQGVVKYLKKVTGLNPNQATTAFKKHNAGLMQGLSKEISDTIHKAIADLTKKGVHVSGGKKEIAAILANAGIDPRRVPFLAETYFRTQSAQAYNAGKWNIVNDPDVGEDIWGFEYRTVKDNRVRPEHRLLEGVRLPKNDKFWKKYLPPNGWNCRCTVLEIWEWNDKAKIDFGVTGVDPRTRTDKELNLLPAFAGNVGVLAAETKSQPTPHKPAAPTVIQPEPTTVVEPAPAPTPIHIPQPLPTPAQTINEPSPHYNTLTLQDGETVYAEPPTKTGTMGGVIDTCEWKDARGKSLEIYEIVNDKELKKFLKEVRRRIAEDDFSDDERIHILYEDGYRYSYDTSSAKNLVNLKYGKKVRSMIYSDGWSDVVYKATLESYVDGGEKYYHVDIYEDNPLVLQAQLNEEAKAILERFALESITATVELSVKCKPFIGGKKYFDDTIGWNFKEGSRVRATIVRPANGKYEVLFGSIGWDADTLEQAFVKARKGMATLKGTDPVNIGIKWEDKAKSPKS